MKTKPVAWKSRTKARLKAKPFTEMKSTILKEKNLKQKFQRDQNNPKPKINKKCQQADHTSKKNHIHIKATIIS